MNQRPGKHWPGALPVVGVGLTLVLTSGFALLCPSNSAYADDPRGKGCGWIPCLSRAVCAQASVASSDADDFANSPALVNVEQILGSPASARRWVQIGQALFAANQIEKARYCFEKAVDLGPRSPPVLLEAATFYHATGRRADGFDRMKRVLAVTREYDKVIFAFYGRIADVPVVLAQGLPQDGSAGRAYFLHLLEGRDLRAARLTWEWLSVHGYLDAVVVRRYLLLLLDDQLYDEATAAFARFLPSPERPSGDNRITHGGFEASPGGLPLDWVITANPHAQALRDDSCAWEGAWSLRIGFDGQENLEYRHAAQQAIVSPGRWRLAARIRTQGITSDQGIGLRIFDARSASRWQTWSGNVTGDSAWTLVEESVVVPPETRLVQIEIVRRPSRKLDNRLGGVAWIDAVSLTPLGARSL